MQRSLQRGSSSARAGGVAEEGATVMDVAASLAGESSVCPPAKRDRWRAPRSLRGSARFARGSGLPSGIRPRTTSAAAGCVGIRTRNAGWCRSASEFGLGADLVRRSVSEFGRRTTRLVDGGSDLGRGTWAVGVFRRNSDAERGRASSVVGIPTASARRRRCHAAAWEKGERGVRLAPSQACCSEAHAGRSFFVIPRNALSHGTTSGRAARTGLDAEQKESVPCRMKSRSVST